MKIEFACPFCRKPHSVEPELAGRRGRCKDCGTVMRIPGERVASGAQKATPREAPAARVSAPAEVKSTTRPRPRSAPVREPEPIVEVNDPYGLADEIPAPSSRQGLVETGVAESEYTPLPRAGFEPSVTEPRRQESEGAWWLSLRRIAMMLMATALYSAVKFRGLLSRTQSSGSWSTARWIFALGIGACVLVGSALIMVSLIGATIGFLRGDRRAFRCETRGQQIGWFASIVVSCLLCGLFITAYLRSNRAGLGMLDARLSATEKADIAVYDRMLSSTVSFHNRFADALETLPAPTSPGGSEAWTALGVLALEGERLKTETHSTPLPTRAQVKELFSRHHAPLLTAFARTAQASHDVVARLNLPADSEFGQMLRETETHCIDCEQIYTKHFPAGATDSAGWYFVVYGSDLAPQR